MRKWFVPLLVALVSLLYYQSIDNPLIMDDIYIFQSMKSSLRQIVYLLFEDSFINYGRFVSEFSFLFGWDYGIPANRVFNITLHLLNSLLFFVFLRSIVKPRVAAFVALFFAVNPAAIHAVCYLVQRNQLFMLFFGLSQCIFFLHSLRSRWWLSPFLFIASLICFQMAAISKEHALALICIYPLMGIASRKIVRGIIYNGLIAGCVFFFSFNNLYAVQGLFSFLSAKAIHRSTNSYNQLISSQACLAIQNTDNIYFRSILTQCGLFFKYFLYWILPFPASIDMRVPFVESSSNVWNLVWFGLYVCGSWVILFIKKVRWIGFGLLIAACLFTSEFTGTRAGEIFVMYRSYLFALGYMIALAGVLDMLTLKRIGVVVILALSIISYFQIKQFDSSKAAWVRAAKLVNMKDQKIYCQSARIFNNAGVDFLKEGNVIEAEKYFRQAIVVNPYWSPPLSNLGLIYYFTGRFDQARQAFEILAQDEHQSLREHAQNKLTEIKQQIELGQRSTRYLARPMYSN